MSSCTKCVTVVLGPVRCGWEKANCAVVDPFHCGILVARLQMGLERGPAGERRHCRRVWPQAKNDQSVVSKFYFRARWKGPRQERQVGILLLTVAFSTSTVAPSSWMPAANMFAPLDKAQSLCKPPDTVKQPAKGNCGLKLPCIGTFYPS